MPTVRDGSPVSAADADTASWEHLGVPLDRVAEWEAIGFGPFEAALAKGDGFTPLNAVHYRRQLQRVAGSWLRNGLGTTEGLEWHRAGFAVREAIGWRRQGIDVETARARSSGYQTQPENPPGPLSDATQAVAQLVDPPDENPPDREETHDARDWRSDEDGLS